jgi:hypothetical protein
LSDVLLVALGVERRGASAGVAAARSAMGFGILSAVGNEHPWTGGLIGFLYFGSGAFAVLRWGLASFAVATFVSTLLMNVPATLDASAWYVGSMLLLLALPVVLASWALHTSVAGRLWRMDALG